MISCDTIVSTSHSSSHVRWALLARARLSQADPHDFQTTALALAAAEGHDRCVGQLLAAGAAVETPSEDGSTPLHWACTVGHEECVRLLLTWRATPNRPDRSGQS